MKKITILSALSLTVSLQVSADQTKDEGWFRDANDFQTYWVNSYDSDYQASMRKVDSKGDSPAYVDFRLIIVHSYCHDKDYDFYDDAILEVNSQEVEFSYSCYDKRVLNVTPYSHEGQKYILEEFKRSGTKNVTFVWPREEEKDWVFHFSTERFKEYYRSVNKSIKKSI